MRDLLKKHVLNHLGNTLHIGITQQSVCLARTSRWGRGAPQLLSEREYADTDVGVALEALLADSDIVGMQVSVILSNDLVRLWQVTPPPGVSRLGDLEAAAAQRFQILYGESPMGWKLSADWNADLPFCAAALPRALLSALEQSCGTRRLTVVAVVPHFINGWNRWQQKRKAGAWFCQISEQGDAGTLTFGVPAEHGRLHAVRALAMPSNPETLTMLMQREALLLDVPAPILLQVCGAWPLSWLAPTSAGKIALERLDVDAPPRAAKLSAAAELVIGSAYA